MASSSNAPATLHANAARAPGLLRLEQFSRLLRRYAWLIALCALVGAAGVFGYARTLPKFYTASSALTVEGDRFNIPELEGALRAGNSPDPMPFVRTEVQAITARPLVRAAVDQLRVADREEFNPDLQAPTLLATIKAELRSLLPPGPASPTPADPMDGVTSNASKALGVFQDNRSLVILVSFTSQDPRLASDFVNTIVTDYIRSRADRRTEATQAANQALTTRIEAVRESLAAIEREMTNLRQTSGLVDVRAGTVGQQQLEELTTAAAQATMERSQLEVTFGRAQAAAKAGSSDTLASVLSSPTISRLRDQESTAQRRLAEFSSRYGADHPTVSGARADLASVRQQLAAESARIVASVDTQLRAAGVHEADVKQQLATAQRNGVEVEASRAKMVQLQQEAATRRTLYQTLLERSQQTVVQPAALATPDVRVLSPAVPPSSPAGPRMNLAGLLGGLGGGVLGMLLALTRLKHVDRVATAEDVTAFTGLSVLATVPSRLLSPPRNGFGVGSVPGKAQMDTMRMLRERVRFAGYHEDPRTVLVVACGKAPSSKVVAALASAAASDGERVLLMEADLGRARLGRMLGPAAPASGGLARAVSGEPWQDVLGREDSSRLQALLGGGGSGEGRGLLRGPQFHNLLLDVREQFDLVLLDAGGEANSIALSERVDLVLLVVAAGTVRSLLKQAERLAEVTRTPLAAVLVTRR